MLLFVVSLLHERCNFKA